MSRSKLGERMVVEDVWTEGAAGAKALGQEDAGCGCVLGPGGWIVGEPGAVAARFSRHRMMETVEDRFQRCLGRNTDMSGAKLDMERLEMRVRKGSRMLPPPSRCCCLL